MTTAPQALSIEEARKRVASCASAEGETTFAREVMAGAWDHRRDVQSALNPSRKLRGETTASEKGLI